MWIFCNPNPCNLLVGDCVVRACVISQEFDNLMSQFQVLQKQFDEFVK